MIKKHPLLTKHIGFRVKESVFHQIECQADAEGKPVNYWCRDRVLQALRHPLPTPSDHAVMAELMATQDMLIDLFCALGRDGRLTVQTAKEIVNAAHKRKYKDVAELLRYAASRLQAAKTETARREE